MGDAYFSVDEGTVEKGGERGGCNRQGCQANRLLTASKKLTLKTEKGDN